MRARKERNAISRQCCFFCGIYLYPLELEQQRRLKRDQRVPAAWLHLSPEYRSVCMQLLALLNAPLIVKQENGYGTFYHQE